MYDPWVLDYTIDPIHVTSLTEIELMIKSPANYYEFDDQDLATDPAHYCWAAPTFEIERVEFECDFDWEIEATGSPEDEVSFRWIPEHYGVLEELNLYLPDTTLIEGNHPALSFTDMFVESFDPANAVLFDGVPTWNALGDGWYRVTLPEPFWVDLGWSYKITIHQPPNAPLSIPYLWADSYPDGMMDIDVAEADTLRYAMPILNAQTYASSGDVVPTHLAQHLMEGVMDPYLPEYGVLARNIQLKEDRLCVDMYQFGGTFSGFTVPIVFQSNALGGGFYGYGLSQTITEQSLNNSILLSYLAVLTQRMLLPSMTLGKYGGLIGDVYKEVNAYDVLEIDQMSTWGQQLPTYKITDYNPDARDEDGNLGWDGKFDGNWYLPPELWYYDWDPNAPNIGLWTHPVGWLVGEPAGIKQGWFEEYGVPRWNVPCSDPDANLALSMKPLISLEGEGWFYEKLLLNKADIAQAKSGADWYHTPYGNFRYEDITAEAIEIAKTPDPWTGLYDFEGGMQWSYKYTGSVDSTTDWVSYVNIGSAYDTFDGYQDGRLYYYDYPLTNADGELILPYQAAETDWSQVTSYYETVGKFYDDDDHGTSESWVGRSKFETPINIRLPTTEPIEWEIPDASGSLDRFPMVELSQIDIELDPAMVASLKLSGREKIWAYAMVMTMEGVNSSVSIPIDLTDYQIGSPLSIEIDTSNYPIWDGEAFMEDQDGYVESGVAAPVVQIELYDANPLEYLSHTIHVDISLSVINEITAIPSKIKEIGDFRRAHLLDVRTVGIPLQTDLEYIETYNQKITDYQENIAFIETTALLSKVVSFVWGALIFVTSIGGAPYTAGTSLSGVVFGFDMMQSGLSGHSIFSFAFGWISALSWESAYGVDFMEYYLNFNIWAPASHSKRWTGRLLEAVWAMAFTIVMAKALAVLGKTLFAKFKPDLARAHARNQMARQEQHMIKTGQGRTGGAWKDWYPDEIYREYLPKQRANIHNTILNTRKLSKVWRRAGGFERTYTPDMSIGQFFSAGQAWSEITGTLRGHFFKAGDAQSYWNTFLSVSRVGVFVDSMQDALRSLKGIVGGFITMAEWFPDSWIGGGLITLTWGQTIKGILRYLLVGWGDNFLYTLVFGENTVMLTASILLTLERGYPVGFIGCPLGPTI